MQEIQERFTDFNLRPELLRALERKGFEHPMPVQTAVLRDESLAGDDLIVQARTGSGKTLAFALPLLNEMEPGARTLNMVRLIAQGERLRFEHEFLSEYRTLTSLTQDLNIPVSISFVHESRWFSEGSPQAGPSQDASESSAWTGRSGQGGSAFGMGAGAIAGVPVPSTDHLVKLTEKGISARLGLNQDSSNPEQVRRVKEEVSPGLAELATSFFSAVEAELNRSFISYANEAWAALDHLLTEYRAAYGHAIAEMREHDLAEQIRVDDELESIRLDHRLVEGHLKVLRVTLERLREI